ncbi:hypothetical protein DMJ13_22795 [halophilic archaeon]|nr:hypothetical protein DMJ13_22795 [halophilic archaeon]
MRYSEAADLLLNLGRSRERFNINPTADLLTALQNPHKEISIIQIAGTNGKGSTAKMTESVLREAGFDVGLYTSPHLSDFRERIQINGEWITEDGIINFTDHLQNYLKSNTTVSLSFFEATTALACWYFAREQVDIAILEVGLGGKHDATSVVDPIASGITSVSLEHTDLLGNSIEEIARDQAHVAPSDGPLVTAASGQALNVITEVTDNVVTVGEEKCSKYYDEPDVRVRYNGRDGINRKITLQAKDWKVSTKLSLLGRYQAQNAGVAAVLAQQVANISNRDLERGLRTAHWPGRFEIIGQDPLVILDGAHNPGACESVARSLEEFQFDSLYIIFGAMKDKDHYEMISALPCADQVITCQPESDHAERPSILRDVFVQAGIKNVSVEQTTEKALDQALRLANTEDCVIVIGSLHIVADVRQGRIDTLASKENHDE